jgi:uncharacterized protein (TIGR00375 family)
MRLFTLVLGYGILAAHTLLGEVAMEFTADLHIHSRFSRATSKKLNPCSLAGWGLLKGVKVLGTGDFTHPQWRQELREQLSLDEDSGLYKLQAPLQAHIGSALPEAMAATLPKLAQQNASPLFMLQAEISSIYKRGGKVRKVHNLVYMPDFEAAERLSRRLEAIGNLASDGRPILGLDSHDLLEIVLECSPQGVLVPAHIWTPWFAVFGSKSGFASIEECYGDLSQHIFALETGLSSDPPMNRLWSHLDRYALISNSDAHSGENLAREVNLFHGSPSYAGIFAALRAAAARSPVHTAGCTFAGTVEFYPEEGKYHLDGHRACNTVMQPEQAKALNNICPVCGKPLTIGVLHRVLDLADRSAAPSLAHEPACTSLIPLPELLGELCGTGSKSQAVQQRYSRLLHDLGSEMDILHNLPLATVHRYWDSLGEAIGRMRAGAVIRQGGYDGEYGTVRVFSPQETRELRYSGKKRGNLLLPLCAVPSQQSCQATSSNPKHKQTAQSAQSLLPLPQQQTEAQAAVQVQLQAKVQEAQAQQEAEGQPREQQTEAHVQQKAQGQAKAQLQTQAQAQAAVQAAVPKQPSPTPHSTSPAPSTTASMLFSAAQKQAIYAGTEPVLVLAGPGAGKTRVLIARVAHLVAQGVPPQKIMAVTFTCRAAVEIQQRLAADPSLSAHAQGKQPQGSFSLPYCDTLHALALRALRQCEQQPHTLLDEQHAFKLFSTAVQASALPASGKAVRHYWQSYSLAREQRRQPPAMLLPAVQKYTASKQQAHYYDYTDLLEQWLAHLQAQASLPDQKPQWDFVLVDEIQDLSPLQYALVLALLPAEGTGFFGIGDPDQAIYGFRGAQEDVAGALRAAWPQLRLLHLQESYRATAAILNAANALMLGQPQCGILQAIRQEHGAVFYTAAPDARAENIWVAQHIASLIGHTSHTLHDQTSQARQQREALAALRRPKGSKAQATEATLIFDRLAGRLAPSDIAILVRMKAQGAALGRQLEAQGIPWTSAPTLPLCAENTIAMLAAGAANALQRHDLLNDLLALGMPQPEQAAQEQQGEHSLLDSVPISLEEWQSGPEVLLARRPQLVDAFFVHSAAAQRLFRLWGEYGDWVGVLQALRQIQEDELLQGKAEQVRILTLHAAKGLEFRAVFIPALEAGLLPLCRASLAVQAGQGAPESTAPEESLAEARRLLYVGMTRAADLLFLSYAAQRQLYGRSLCLPPSPLLRPVLPLCHRLDCLHKAQHAEQQLLLF